MTTTTMATSEAGLRGELLDARAEVVSLRDENATLRDENARLRDENARLAESAANTVAPPSTDTAAHEEASWAVERATALPEVWALVAAHRGVLGARRLMRVCRAARAGGLEFHCRGSWCAAGVLILRRKRRRRKTQVIWRRSRRWRE
jgi:hypothetical protein